MKFDISLYGGSDGTAVHVETEYINLTDSELYDLATYIGNMTSVRNFIGNGQSNPVSGVQKTVITQVPAP